MFKKHAYVPSMASRGTDTQDQENERAGKTNVKKGKSNNTMVTTRTGNSNTKINNEGKRSFQPSGAIISGKAISSNDALLMAAAAESLSKAAGNNMSCRKVI